MGLRLRLLLAIAFIFTLAPPARAQQLRVGTPDACMGVLIPCAQIADLGLQLRLSGVATWPAPAASYALGGAIGLGLSLAKSIEAAVAVPVSYGPGWSAGPLDVSLRFRIGPRMGVTPSGRAWPRDEPYPRALPVDHEVRPARATAALGLHFRSSVPGLRGGQAGCAGTCTIDAAASLSGDLRLGPFLFTAHGRVGITDMAAQGGAGRGLAQVGGRASLFLAGDAVVLFTEGLGQLDIAPPFARGAALLAGAQLGDFRTWRVTAWYARLVGAHDGNAAGVVVDVPFGVYGYDPAKLRHLADAIDPFLGGDGWLYSDACAPMFRVGKPGAYVWNEHRGDWATPGLHLWEKGGRLYRDQAATDLYMPVLPRVGTPPAPPEPLVRIPWPSYQEAQRYPELARKWLQRYALGPDPERRAQCADLMDQLTKQAEAAARAPTLAERCARAKREAEDLRQGASGDLTEDGRRAAGSAILASRLMIGAACEEEVRGEDFAALAAARRPPNLAPRRPSRATKAEVDAQNRAEHGGVELCVYCGSEMTPATRRTKGSKVQSTEKQYDHSRAWSRGGGSEADDLDLSCAECNNGKGAKDWPPWLLKPVPQTPRSPKK